MKSFAESKRRKPFDWLEFLSRPQISEAAWRKAKDLAAHWVTCACGNQCKSIPRAGDFYQGNEEEPFIPINSPMDQELRSLGYRFNDAIYGRNVRAALIVLNLIEKRAAILIARIKRKKSKKL